MATPSLSLWRRRHDKEARDDEADEKWDKEEEKEKEQESDDKAETEDIGSHDKEKDSNKKEVLRERMGQEELNSRATWPRDPEDIANGDCGGPKSLTNKWEEHTGSKAVFMLKDNWNSELLFLSQDLLLLICLETERKKEKEKEDWVVHTLSFQHG